MFLTGLEAWAFSMVSQSTASSLLASAMNFMGLRMCLNIHVSVCCLFLLFVFAIVPISMFTVEALLAVVSTLQKTVLFKSYQLYDVWVLRALIDSIYLYTLPL